MATAGSGDRGGGPEGWYADRAVLVTGGAGFIGSHLVERLAAAGARVRVLDDFSTGHESNLAGVRGRVEVRRASILDDAALREAVAGCAVVFHEAAMVSAPLSVEKPLECIRVNVEGTARVLEAARGAGVRRVVFAASAAAYGSPSPERLPCREDAAPEAWSPYAMSKIAGEQLLSSYSRCFGLSTVSLRYFNIFGERQDPRSAYAAAISAFAAALEGGRRPTIFGDGRQTRDFTHVANVVDANLLAGASAAPLLGEVINIGTGARVTLLEVLATLAGAMGVKADPVFAPARAGDVRDSVADISRARRVLGYEPRVSLAEGLARLVAWLRR
jgi:UDP-glucose 4-epimerase